MSKSETMPSKIAIFLSQSQIEICNSKKISDILIDSFFKKIIFLFPNIEILSNFNFNLVTQFRFIQSETELEFLFAVNELLPPSISGDSDFDEVFFAYFLGISPLLSLELSQELLGRHVRYLAQYSYSENLPKGIVPNYISREFIVSLPNNIPATAHDFLIKNLNNYDTEIFYKEPDLRQFRLDFTLSDLRSLRLVEFYLNLNPNLEYNELYNAILKNPNGFRLAPSYIEMEIFRGCESECTFCPRQFISNELDGNKLSIEFIETFLAQLEETFPFPVTICLGGMGEPLLHPQIKEIVTTILNYTHLKELIIETALYPNVDGLLNTLSTLDSKREKLSLIVNLTTLKENKYKEIYKNKTNVKTTLEKISSFTSLLGKSNIHIQMIKMKEIEEEIEEYFTFFEKLGINVILQKYNRFAGLMPEKRVSDLTPIKREFCWHLNRDLFINSDGSVSICKQDFQTQIGNLNSESIFTIWEKGMKTFSESLNGNHNDTNAPCLNCDEWYTFNA